MSKTIDLVFPKDIDGWLGEEEGEILYWLAQKNINLGCVVELGSFHGKSTICLAQGTKKVNGGKVYALDNFMGDRYIWFRKKSFYNKFVSNIQKYSLSDLIEPIKGDFSEIVKDWNKPIRLLFIDGSHSYTDVKKDFTKWESKVSNGGTIVFHDALAWPGVTKFVSEIIKSGKYSSIKTNDTYSGLVYLTKSMKGEELEDANKERSLKEFKDLLKKRKIKTGLLTAVEKMFIRN